MDKSGIIKVLGWLMIALLGVAGILFGAALLPGKIDGSYRGLAPQCACDSMNFMRFHEGHLIMYCSNHPPAEWMGRYEENPDGSVSVYLFSAKEGEADQPLSRAIPHLLLFRFSAENGKFTDWYSKTPEIGQVRDVIGSQEIVSTKIRRDGLIEKKFYDAGFNFLRSETTQPKKGKTDKGEPSPPSSSNFSK